MNLSKEELWRVLGALEIDRKGVLRNQNMSRFPAMKPVFEMELAVLDGIKAKVLKMYEEAKEVKK